jgi:hypothetical protein
MSILSLEDRRLIERSAAHALADGIGPAFRNGVTDLDVARLILRLEQGAIVVQAKGGRSWHTLPRGERMPPLTRVVQECLRLGLVYRATIETGPAVRRVQLAAAPIHRRLAPNTTRCNASLLRRGLRWRTTLDARLVDCFACRSLTGQAY